MTEAQDTTPDVVEATDEVPVHESESARYTRIRREAKARAAVTVKAEAKAAQRAKAKAQAKVPVQGGLAEFQKRAKEIEAQQASARKARESEASK